MALTDTQIESLQQLAQAGTVPVVEYIAVEWDANDANQTRYYATAKYNEMSPYGSIGIDIEPRLIGSPFDNMELNPDLRTDTINLTFDDIDGVIRGRFQTYGSGVRCEIFFYFPTENVHHSFWFGQLQAPEVRGWKKTVARATNGFRSREQKVPKSVPMQGFCRFAFGGQLTAEALITNGCDYDIHLGGTRGNYRTGIIPYTSCPKDPTACAARGMSDRFGGFTLDASAVVTDNNSGYLAVSKGNASALNNPIRKIYGTKTVRSLQLLLWRREMNASNQDRGFVAGVWLIGEGPMRAIRNFKVGEKIIEATHQSHRLGTRGQPALTQYAPNISNFSHTAVSFNRKGWVDPLTENPQTMTGECVVEGCTTVPVLQVSGSGAGLKGQYYTGTTFTNLAAERVDATINFEPTSIVPFNSLNQVDGFGIKWTGTITFEFSETFTFTLIHDDGGKVIVNGSTIIDQASAGTHTGTFAATAGVAYTIEVRLTQNSNIDANPWSSILKWQSTSQSLEVIPVTAFNHSGVSSVARQWTNNRVWCLLDLMTDSKMGMSYPFARFDTANWVEVGSWSAQLVTFAFTNTDSETRTFSHKRTQFDCVVEGRSVAEQIVDICRSGRFSVPYQSGGVLKIAAFRAFTQDELDNAPTFYDSGDNQNIFWSDGAPAIEYAQRPDDQITNEIKLVFEDGSNGDNARPITVDDPDQKALAGRNLGYESLQDIPTEFAAFGVKNLNEAVKLGYGLLRFGQFDEGGTQNNGTVTVFVPLVWALKVERHGPIKVVSELFDGLTLPGGDTVEYFRVLQIFRVSKDMVKIVAQVYNHTKYTSFETVDGSGDPPPWPPPYPGPDPRPDPNPLPDPQPCQLTLQSVEYDTTGQNLIANVEPC